MPLLRALSRVVDLFWARTEIPGHSLYARLDRSHATARTLTRCYYAGLLLIAFWHMSLWNYYRGLRDIQPLWPVAWAASVPDRAATVVLLLFASGSLLAAVFPDRLLARCLAFAGCLEFFAFVYSFGTIRHVHHLLVLTTFVFIFLPRGPGDNDDAKKSYLRAFWGVQCCALLTYSMSGLAKIVTGVWHLATRQDGVLTPSAFARHVANAGFRFGVEPPLGDLAIRAGGLGLPFYLAVIYLETCSLLVAFRPRLHRVWGAALIMLHLAIGLTLNLFFLPSIFVLGVLLLASPFSPESPESKWTARDLPLIGRLLAGSRPTA